MKEYIKPKINIIKSELLKALMTKEFLESNKSTVAIGYDEKSLSATLLDIEKAPHVMLAGATGSGKSVLMHNIISIPPLHRPHEHPYPKFCHQNRQ